jgi:hypothetical protein
MQGLFIIIYKGARDHGLEKCTGKHIIVVCVLERHGPTTPEITNLSLKLSPFSAVNPTAWAVIVPEGSEGLQGEPCLAIIIPIFLYFSYIFPL